jgi:hypothetical protein
LRSAAASKGDDDLVAGDDYQNSDDDMDTYSCDDSLDIINEDNQDWGFTIYKSGHKYSSGPNIVMFHCENNIKSSGRDFGTQAIYLGIPPIKNVTVYNSTTPLTLKVLDYYGNHVQTSQNARVKVSLTSFNCLETRSPDITGKDVESGVQVVDGYATFSHLISYCYPTGEMSLKFLLDPMPVPAELFVGDKSGIYEISKETQLSFRDCVAGEYLNEIEGKCVVCPPGSYSLTWSKGTVCESCRGMVGVEWCEDNDLHLFPGYWRRHQQTTAILPCLLGEAACPGGPGYGDEACAEGYHGPFCGLCVDGYVLNYGRCILCEETDTSPAIIASGIVLSLLIGGFLLILIVMWIRREQNKHNKDYQPWKLELFILWMRATFERVTIKLKIVIATYQLLKCLM